ncbi:MAG: tetratricopeptide repeat protein [Bacteroidota bacterium]|jgi:tetratricopeptide (TPR) repeat protein|nr:tetratricopeptide repeat protein [Saprospiraceae bacterium]
MTPRHQQLLDLYAASPGDAFILFALAKECENSGDAAAALSYYKQLRELHPGYIGLYYHLGKLYELMNDEDQAAEVYRAGIELGKNTGDRHATSELLGALANIGI